MGTVKHFTFNRNPVDGAGNPTDAQRGRFAVAIDGTRLIVRQLAGCAPYFRDVAIAIGQWPELVELMNEAAQSRQNPYVTYKRTGMSGCVDYILREQRDAATADYPIRARIHISMWGKLNEGIQMWLGDFPALYHAADRGEQWDNTPGNVEEVEVFRNFDHWAMPGLQLLKVEDGFIYAVSTQPTNEYADPEVLAKLQKEYGIFTDAETVDYDEVMA